MKVVTRLYSNTIRYSNVENQEYMNGEKSVLTEKKCSLRDVLDIIGGKWSMPIIYALSTGTMRFKELERKIEGINTRMLVKELKNMESHGIITRAVFATVPPTVEYTLTEKGCKLMPIIVSLHQWGKEYAVEQTTSPVTGIF